MENAASHRERSFGLSVGSACGLIAGVSIWRGHSPLATGLGLVAVGLVVPALIRPSWLRWPSAMWWRLAEGLAWVNSRLLLSLLFYGVLTPLGCAMRLGGWDPMRRRRKRSSGWIPYPERIRDPKHYERLY